MDLSFFYPKTVNEVMKIIDKRKNVCYVIHVNYIRNNKVCKQKFLSQHQSTSRRFEEFMEHYFKTVNLVSIKKIGDFDGVISTQWTVGREIWQDVKQKVLEGTTEKEKCY